MCICICPGVQPPDQPNMAFWQLTADLPFTLELTFLGGQSDVGEQTAALTADSQHALCHRTRTPEQLHVNSKQLNTQTPKLDGSSAVSTSDASCQAGSEPTEGDKGLVPRAKRWLRGLLPVPPPAAALPTAGGSGSGPAAERVAALTGADSASAQALKRVPMSTMCTWQMLSGCDAQSADDHLQ